MPDINKLIAEQWKTLNNEDRMWYKEVGQSDFQQRTESWNRALAQSNHDNSAITHSLAFTRMN